jgi:hypothetical protein
MDTSKKFIELCEKATEIQDLWQYDDGDFYCHRFTEKNLSDQRFKDMIGKEINMTLCISCNVKDSYGDQYVSEYNPKGENVWLPRQDQLQSLYAEGRFSVDGVSELMTDFYEFCYPWDRLGTMPLPVAAREAEREDKYVRQFISMEQLWLAFVMKENFKKIWNGSEWENDN